MKTNALPLVAALSALSFNAGATTLNVAIDLSGSNPLLSHENFAYAAATYVADTIGPLKSGDIVRVQTFGARGDPANLLDQSYLISRRVRPEAVAAVVTQFIRSLPGRKDISQGATEILGFLELHPGFDCEQGGQILILTDGVESSGSMQAQALVDGKASLPKPDISLAGCSLTFYGLGAGLPPQMVKNIRAGWARWAEQAGTTLEAVVR